MNTDVRLKTIHRQDTAWNLEDALCWRILHLLLQREFEAFDQEYAICLMNTVKTMAGACLLACCVEEEGNFPSPLVTIFATYFLRSFLQIQSVSLFYLLLAIILDFASGNCTMYRIIIVLLSLLWIYITKTITSCSFPCYNVCYSHVVVIVMNYGATSNNNINNSNLFMDSASFNIHHFECLWHSSWDVRRQFGQQKCLKPACAYFYSEACGNGQCLSTA